MSGTSKLVGLFALLPPIVALAGTLALLSSYEESPTSGREWKELVNAGTVVNGVKRREGAVVWMESQLAKTDPKVVILGNSYANTNVAPDQIAYALGVPRHKVLTLSVPNSVSSHWYAILQHRVYDDGYQVPLVVVVAAVQSLLLYEPYSEASYEDLMVHLEPREPTLGQYIDLSHPELRNLARNRMLFRDVALNLLRDRTLDLFFTGGSEAHTAALEGLFSDENIDNARHDAGALEEETMEGVPAPEDSMIEELARMIQANGSTLVFVRSPVLQDRVTETSKKDVVPPETLREVEAILMRYGHHFLDLHDLNLPPAAFKNNTHMSPEGARLFTVELNRTLVEVWGEDHRPQRVRDLPSLQEMEGLEDLGEGLPRRRGR